MHSCVKSYSRNALRVLVLTDIYFPYDSRHNIWIFNNNSDSSCSRYHAFDFQNERGKILCCTENYIFTFIHFAFLDDWNIYNFNRKSNSLCNIGHNNQMRSAALN